MFVIWNILVFILGDIEWYWGIWVKNWFEMIFVVSYNKGYVENRE